MRVTKAFYFNPDLIANHITECFGLDCGYTKKICDIDIPDDFTIAYVTGESGWQVNHIERDVPIL